MGLLRGLEDREEHRSACKNGKHTTRIPQFSEVISPRGDMTCQKPHQNGQVVSGSSLSPSYAASPSHTPLLGFISESFSSRISAPACKPSQFQEHIRVCAKSLQSCLTLCDPIDYSLQCSSVHGIVRASILEWVALPSSRGSS